MIKTYYYFSASDYLFCEYHKNQYVEEHPEEKWEKVEHDYGTSEPMLEYCGRCSCILRDYNLDLPSLKDEVIDE